VIGNRQKTTWQLENIIEKTGSKKRLDVKGPIRKNV
jgi:hypothetical protein